MKNRARLALAVCFCVAGLAAAPVAQAKPGPSGSIPGSGSYKYTDAKDRFCVTAASSNPGRYISARMVSLEGKDRGPTKTVTSVGGQGTKCVSLKYAYEDTQYRVVVRGNTGKKRVHTFDS